MFVDFSKAYDRLDRRKLLAILKRLGCGCIMLTAIAAMYMSTKSILCTAVIAAHIGVRQGSPTSCLLFVIYLNELVRAYRTRSKPDGYLGWLHCLLLMDDTVILANNRERCKDKFEIMTDFCEDVGVSINVKKTMFMVIKGNAEDREPITSGRSTIHHCDSYTYLGSLFLEDTSFTSFLKAHTADKK